MFDALLDLGGAFLGYKGQKDTNKANMAIAREQMDFQERMSNTAHTREVADLKEAGLNPILSSKYGGSSTPPGASAVMGNALGAGVSTALQSARLRADLDNIASSTDKNEADATLSRTLTNKAIEDAKVSTSTARNLDAQHLLLQADIPKQEVLKSIYKGVQPFINSAADNLRKSQMIRELFDEASPPGETVKAPWYHKIYPPDPKTGRYNTHYLNR